MSPDKHKYAQQPGNREEAKNHGHNGNANSIDESVRVAGGGLSKVPMPAFARVDHASSIAEAV